MTAIRRQCLKTFRATTRRHLPDHIVCIHGPPDEGPTTGAFFSEVDSGTGREIDAQQQNEAAGSRKRFQRTIGRFPWMISQPFGCVFARTEPGMPGMATPPCAWLLSEGAAHDSHFRMQRCSVDIEWLRWIDDIKVDGVIAAVLAVSLFRGRKNLRRTLKTWHQDRDADFPK